YADGQRRGTNQEALGERTWRRRSKRRGSRRRPRAIRFHTWPRAGRRFTPGCGCLRPRVPAEHRGKSAERFFFTVASLELRRRWKILTDGLEARSVQPCGERPRLCSFGCGCKGVLSNW